MGNHTATFTFIMPFLRLSKVLLLTLLVSQAHEKESSYCRLRIDEKPKLKDEANVIGICSDAPLGVVRRDA